MALALLRFLTYIKRSHDNEIFGRESLFAYAPRISWLHSNHYLLETESQMVAKRETPTARKRK